MFNHESYEEVAQHKCRIISETAISETCTMFKQIKKLKLVSKQTDIQAFFVIFAFATALSETAVSKNNIKRNCKTIEI